ncbi:MAG: ABC transporter substrate-binding protein, partial [Acidimicrobiales bacterium]
MDVRVSLSRRGFLQGAGALALGTARAGCAPAARAGGPVTIELWHGQSDIGRKVIEELVADIERTHPGIRVNPGGGVLA